MGRPSLRAGTTPTKTRRSLRGLYPFNVRPPSDRRRHGRSRVRPVGTPRRRAQPSTRHRRHGGRVAARYAVGAATRLGGAAGRICRRQRLKAWQHPPPVLAVARLHTIPPRSTWSAACAGGRAPHLRDAPAGRVIARGNPTDRRPEMFVWQQANKSLSVGPSGRATKPEQNAIVFADTVDLFRGGTMHVLGPHKRNVFNPMPNEEPRKDASLPLTHRQGGVESKTDLSALICLSATGKEVVRSSVVLRHGQRTTGDACGMSSTTTPSPRRSGAKRRTGDRQNPAAAPPAPLPPSRTPPPSPILRPRPTPSSISTMPRFVLLDAAE